MTYAVYFRGGKCHIGSRCRKNDGAADVVYKMCRDADIEDLYGARTCYAVPAVEDRIKRAGVDACAAARGGAVYCHYAEMQKGD